MTFKLTHFAPILALTLFLTLLVFIRPAYAQGPIYVDQNASGNNDGATWDDAYLDLQGALTIAQSGDEIWVASGVYIPGGNRNATFNVPPGVKLYGGFAGGETDLNERDWTANVTVLSGDIDNDDTTDANGVVTRTTAIVGSNAYHVVYLDGTTTAGVITGSTRLDGFTVTAGNANDSFDQDGGGMYCNGQDSGHVCSPTIANVTFSGNLAGTGGGMYNNGKYSGMSSPSLVNVTFSGNSAIYYHGGGMYNNSANGGVSSPSLVNVIFSDNSANQDGGGMYNGGGGGGDSSPSLVNVTFSGNSANNQGGGMYNNGESIVFSGLSSPSLVNVTFSGNSANSGGGMYNNGNNGNSSPSLVNVVLWGNTATDGQQIYNFSATPAISYSLIQGSGGSASWDTSLGTDSGYNLDSDPLFVDADGGDLRLQSGSPAIDVGDNSAVPAGVTTDLAGHLRIWNGTVEMGAYEFGSPACPTAAPIYVNQMAGGSNSGESWTDALTSLQAGLTLAHLCGLDEIWVASGVYIPGATVDDRFNVPPGVKVYGGFAGGETDLSQRDWTANVTVLSGDIDNNDTTDANGVVAGPAQINGDNAYHVVYLDGATAAGIITGSTRLDGFTVTAGNANSSASPDLFGGGLFCDGSSGYECSPSLANVIFSGNRANKSGGGMYNNGSDGSSSPSLVNVTFSGNSANNYGGGMYNDGYNGVSSPSLVNVTFSGNWADTGGGMYNAGDSGAGSAAVALTNTKFISNTATTDSGAFYTVGDVTISDSLFRGNAAQAGDNGAFYTAGIAVITHTDFISNTAANNVGGFIADGGVSISDSLFQDNVAQTGNDGGFYTGGIAVITHTDFISNTAQVGHGGFRAAGAVTISDSLFQGNAAQGGQGAFGTGGAAVITNTDFISNTAGTDGGGFFADGNVTISDSLFQGNAAQTGNDGGFYTGGIAVITHTDFISNTAQVSRGGFGADGAVTISDSLFQGNAAQTGNDGGFYTGGIAVITHTDFISNTATADSGAFYTVGDVTISDSLFQGNAAQAGDNGAFYTAGIAVITHTDFISNTAANNYGGFRAESDVSISDSLFRGNAAQAGDNGAFYTAGIAVITHTDFISNTANNQGGFRAESDVSISDSLFRGNTAQARDNGAFYTAGIAVITRTDFISNTAGGAVGAFRADGDVTISDSLFQGNAAQAGGTGAFYTTGAAVITNTDFINNTAQSYQGGFGADGDVTISDSLFQGNVAQTSLGAFGARAAVITNTDFISNTAGTYSGAIEVYGDVTISDSLFRGNKAQANDNGAISAGGDATIRQSQFINNYAGGSSGAIWVGGKAAISDSLFQSNYGGDNSGLEVDGRAYITNTQFISNTANTKRGAASLAGGGVLNKVLFRHNLVGSGGYGAAVYSQGSLDITNSLLANNGVSGGGAVVKQEGNGAVMTIVHTTIASATLGSGPAIEVVSGTLALTNTIIAHYTTGLSATSGVVAEDYNLLAGNTTDRVGVTPGAHSLSGSFADAGFVDAAGGNFHLTSSSVALNKGINLGVTTDYDGDTRPAGGGFDLGYDETTYSTGSRVYLPVIIKP